ncbi:helix-turn-helix domain-containing protein [Flavobacterium stagni]|uniref:DNA-binding protein n=1 Tax=Flavobacterium stagni TaxID=2506421 RepID=A0A4Q1KED6_9FLAO|nr:helix-turn-helix domain-containing protein [Flavobacterium stagni]RXR24673.1 DNA-binding protein [Flavobacterium stagni]
MRETIQIENINSEDFKNEIINGVVERIKNLAQNFTSNQEDNILLTREETAKLLSISLVKLWSLTRDKKFPVYHIGKSVRYKKSEVLNVLKVINNNDH